MVCLRPLLSLLVVGLLPVGAGAAPSEGPIVKEKDLKPYRAELQKRLQQVKEHKSPIGAVLAELKAAPGREKSPRLAAIRHYLYGFLLMELGQKRDARAAFEKGLQLQSRFPALYVGLALLAYEAKDTGAAKRKLNQALALDADDVQALTLLAGIYQADADLDEALRLFKRSFDIDPQPAACIGIANNYVARWRQSFNPKEKKILAANAVQHADVFVALAPRNGHAYVFRSKVLQDLGRGDDAVQSLEECCRADVRDRDKLEALHRIFLVRLGQNRLEEGIKALKRMLAFKSIIKGQARVEIEKKIKDLEERGGLAFTLWEIEKDLKNLANPGVTPLERREALRTLLRFFRHPKVRSAASLREMRREIFRSIVGVLQSAPPKVSTEVFRFFQTDFKDAHLLRILVHFIYPNDGATRTPEVRLEAVRTIAVQGGVAALPTLYYCLRDEPGDVLRQVERSLASLCDVRSRVGGGLAPLDDEQKKQARIAWRKFFLSRDGVEKMREALKELRKVLDMDPGFNRSQETKPVADHVVWTILLDDDMPYEVWLPAYEFLRDYLAKEFRPVARRGRPVEPGERPAIVKEIEEFFGGKNQDLPAVSARSENGTK